MKIRNSAAVVVVFGLALAGEAIAQGTGFRPPSTVMDAVKYWFTVLAILAAIAGLIGAMWHAYYGRIDKFFSWVIGTLAGAAGLAAIGLVIVPAIQGAMSYLPT